MTLDYYERHLLAPAVEACASRSSAFGKDDDWWFRPQMGGTTRRQSLTALLRDLGVEVPERPSAEKVAEFRSMAEDEDILLRIDPLLAAAVLEAGR